MLDSTLLSNTNKHNIELISDEDALYEVYSLDTKVGIELDISNLFINNKQVTLKHIYTYVQEGDSTTYYTFLYNEDNVEVTLMLTLRGEL